MDRTLKNDDERLSAYIDGELSADEAAALVERLANEPALVQRLEAMRAGDDAVRAVYRNLDDLPLPDGVTRLLEADTAGPAAGNVVPMRRRVMPRFVNLPVAIAASIALVAGFLALRQTQDDPHLNAVDAMVAGRVDKEVHELLETAISGIPERLGDSAEVQVVLSFESESGDYCRQLYVAATERSVHGVACRGTSGWQLEAVAVGAPGVPGGQFQPAASDAPEPVLAAIDGLIGDRDSLSIDEEKALISESWKKSRD